MRPSSSTQRGFTSRTVTGTTAARPVGAAGLATTLLLAVILATGPLVLGAARLWLELPLLVGVAVLLLIQGLRLTSNSQLSALRQMDAIDLTVVIFVLYTIVRWLTSPAEYFSRIEAMDVVAYAVVFFTCRYGLGHRKLGLALLFGLVALGVFETGFGYYLSCNPDFFPFGTTERLQLYYAPRWVGTYGCPNHYGALLVMAIGAALAMGCYSKLAWPLRIIFFYLAGMMSIGVMCSGSRGTWLGMVASICALMIFGLRNGTVRWWIPVSATALLLVFGGVFFSTSTLVQDRMAAMEDLYKNGTLDATYVRIELAKDALRIAHDHPLFGTGPGTFVFVHPRYQSSTFTRKAVLTHDDYLNCLDDYGVVGFGIAMVFVIAVTLKFFQPLRAENRWQDRVTIVTGFAAWSALLVHSLVDFNLHIPANALLLFALTGLGLGRLTRLDGSRHWSTLSLEPLGRWLGWALVLLSLLYGFEAGRTALGDIFYERAFAQALNIPASESIDSAEKALKYDRGNVQDLIFLGDLHRFNAARQQDIEGRVDEGQKALDFYRQAYRLNALDDTVEGRMGMSLDLMRRYAEAFFCYKLAVTEQPHNGEFWSWLGNHYWQRGMLEKAEQAYLIGSQCPHGIEDNVEAEKELRALPEMEDVPLPAPGTNPLEPAPGDNGEHPPTTP